MINTLWEILTSPEWWGYALRILLFFLAAFLVHKLSRRIARRFVKFRFFPGKKAINLSRQETMRDLTASAIAILGYLLAILLSLNQFVTADTLLWIVGLFSAAFGLGARPLISDLLTGAGFLFEDTFAVGEKIDVAGVEGVVEAVNVLTTWLRSSTGELLIIPNGEIRIVRNFSRGRFSVANVIVRVETPQLKETLNVLETLGQEAVHLLPDLIEPWKIISATGEVGEHTELTLLAHAKFGMAAELRPRLFTLVHDRLADKGIAMVGQ